MSANVLYELMRRMWLLELKADFQCFYMRSDGAIVKTPDGTLFIPLEILIKQTYHPESITNDDLIRISRCL